MCDRRDVRPRHIQLLYPPQGFDTGWRREPVAGPDIRNDQHVGAVTVELEPLVHALAKNGGRERPERLPELDLEVHDRLHRRRARITDDRAAPERSGSEFHSPKKKADDFLRGDESRDLPGDRRTRDATCLVIIGCEEFRHLLFAEARSEIRPVHSVCVLIRRVLLDRRSLGGAGGDPWICQVRNDPAYSRWPLPRPREFRADSRFFEMPVPEGQRNTKRSAGIARSRLDPDLIERPLPKDPAVADAVERHPAGKAQIAQTRFAMR